MHNLRQQFIPALQNWFKGENRQSGWDQVGQASAIALAFAIPISTAITSTLAMIILITWAAGPNQSEKWQILRYHPLLKWVYLFVILAFVGATYSDANARAIRHGLTDALRLAWIPILIYYYQPEKIGKAALWAFVSAMVLTLCLAFLKVYGGFPIGLKLTTGAVFKSHIKTSYFMAMAAFFLMLQVKTLPQYRGWIMGLIALMVYYLFFMSIGRIGYMTLLIVTAVLAWEQYRFKGLCVAMTGFLLLIIGAYFLSDVFAQRLLLLGQDLVVYQQGGDLQVSSLGSRLSFALNSFELIKAHPWFGTGTGSFGVAYSTLPDFGTQLFTDNPHNEFLRMGVEYGLLGILLLVSLFYRQWRLSDLMQPDQRLLWQGILFTFIVGCCFNSWLKDFTEGYFFCVMTAMCFAQLPLLAPKVVRKMVMH